MRFRFVDRIDKVSRFKFARGTKTISFEEGFLDSPLAEAGYIPRTLLIECAAQMVSWLVLYSTDFTKLPLIANIDRAMLERSVPCGAALTIEATVESWNDDGALLYCSAYVDGSRVAEGNRCICTFVGLERLHDPEEMRIRFRELSKDAEID